MEEPVGAAEGDASASVRDGEERQRCPRIFDRFFDSSSSEEGEDEFRSAFGGVGSGAVESASKRLDYMIQFLERKLSSGSDSKGGGLGARERPLPEIVGNGGGTGIFKLPKRASVDPGRPPCLELRPHPLRETQIGCSLRTIACTDSQLWAGLDCGLRFWNFSDLYAASSSRRSGGDEEAAPFCESAPPTSPTICLIADSCNRLIWSGHKDGRIRSWKMDHFLHAAPPFTEWLSWDAHRSPVLSIAITSYGDLWSGTEAGVIKIWPWEAIEKALSLGKEERHMAALLVERSYIDLRSQVSVNGTWSIFTSDIKYLLSDNARAKVWSAGYSSFAMWDARTRELLKVLNVDCQIENRVDMLYTPDFLMEDEVKLKTVSGPKKEKTQSSFNFLQRSRNVIMGAADAVRRVAAKGTFGDDNRRTEALIIAADGKIWTGSTNGLLMQWDGNGNHLQDFQYLSSPVQCLCTFGSRIWVGYISGVVQVLDLDGNFLGGWAAHNSPIVKMAIGAGYVFTLASHGGVRGWNITSPGPLDLILSSELAAKEFIYTRIEHIKILAGTWNVGQGRASHDSLISWLGSAAMDVGIVVVGLQEVEMGAGVLAMSAAKETVGLEGSSVGQWWLEMVGKTLDEGSTFERVGSRQLAGLLIAVWVRNNLRPHVGDVDAAAVPCGFGRAIGNKGAVGLRVRVLGRIMCFVNCHFAAHQEAVNRRNADFEHVYRSMIFSRASNFVNAATAGVSSAIQMLRGANAALGVQSSEEMPELSEADMIIFLGDFNYRLNGISYDEARDFISQRCFDWLRERDQLQVEMRAGKVFQGMREAIIRFPPTYKFERHQVGLAGYDSGEKKRIPAWCDRILYRDSRVTLGSECNLECPVVSSISQYEACMDVTDSDHKPVRCIFSVDIARVDESVRRQEFGDIIASNEKIRLMLEEFGKVPETIVSTNNIILQNQETSILRITNKSGRDKALYEILCEGQSTIKEDGKAHDHCPIGSFAFPRWLQVTPATGIIKSDHIAEVSVHHDQFHTFEEFVDGVPQNWWCEDTRDKEVILIIKVRGSCTTMSTSHRVSVRQCCSGKTYGNDSEINNSGQVQGNILHRSNIQHISNSYEVIDHLQNLHSP